MYVLETFQQKNASFLGIHRGSEQIYTAFPMNYRAMKTIDALNAVSQKGSSQRNQVQ